MSTAANHMKRSHYSQQRHYMAQMNNYKNRVQMTNNDETFLKKLAGIFRKDDKK